jgi:hypothetical protein
VKRNRVQTHPVIDDEMMEKRIEDEEVSLNLISRIREGLICSGRRPWG